MENSQKKERNSISAKLARFMLTIRKEPFSFGLVLHCTKDSLHFISSLDSFVRFS